MTSLIYYCKKEMNLWDINYGAEKGKDET